MGKHFEFTGETKQQFEIYPTRLHRIRATKDLPEHGVKAGDLGGWIEHEENLQDHAWVFDEAKVFNGAVLKDYAYACGNAEVGGGAVVQNYAEIRNTALVYNRALVQGNATVEGNATVRNNAVISDEAVLFGTAEVSGNAKVSGYARLGGRVHVKGEALVRGHFCLTDKVEITSECDISHPQHLMVIGSIGSESRKIVFARPQDLTKPVVEIGCWTGPLDHMMTEVHDRAKRWNLPPNTKQLLIAEYESAHQLLEARLQTWQKETEAF